MKRQPAFGQAPSLHGSARRLEPQMKRQRGVALYIVMVLVLLAMLLALWASRLAWLTELVIGNDIDYQRAFEASQALLQDAQDDIALHVYLPNAQALRTGADAQFPDPQTHSNQLASMQTWTMGLGGSASGCAQGICQLRTGAQNFWEDSASLSAMLASGARYGTYSGAEPGAQANPILALQDSHHGGWYWIEPLLSQRSDSEAGALEGGAVQLPDGEDQPSDRYQMLFRITALSFGLKGSGAADANGDPPPHSPTMAVLQSLIYFPVPDGQ